MSRRWFPFVLALFVAGSTFAGQASASEAEPSVAPSTYASGELVVRYAPGSGPEEQSEARDALGADVESSSPSTGLEVLEVPEGIDVEEAAAAAESLPQVLYAEPNYAYRMAGTPGDPMYRDQWALKASNRSGMLSGIDTPTAWDETTGSPAVTVAVVDSGVDGTHPDLAPNMWTNSGESGGLEANGVDDDANGLVDDWRGWDWTEDDNDPADSLGHGTHTAGTIGAAANNGVGVVGVNWLAKLMPLRVMDANGVGYATDVAEAFSYAGQKGAQVVNASLTGPEFSQAMYDAIASAPNTLFVVAAGNEGKDNDASPSYPCNFTLPNLLCVTATGEFNELTPFSNWGAASVDLAAPGMRIISTWPGGGYAEGMGTSAAAPHVAGAAALVWNRTGGTPLSVANALLRGVEPLPELQGRTVSGGRLNAAGALGKRPAAGESLRERRGDRDGKDRRCTRKRRFRDRRRQRRHRRACRAARH